MKKIISYSLLSLVLSFFALTFVGCSPNERQTPATPSADQEISEPGKELPPETGPDGQGVPVD